MSPFPKPNLDFDTQYSVPLYPEDQVTASDSTLGRLVQRIQTTKDPQEHALLLFQWNNLRFAMGYETQLPQLPKLAQFHAQEAATPKECSMRSISEETHNSNLAIQYLEQTHSRHSHAHISQLTANTQPIKDQQHLRDFFNKRKYFISEPNFLTLHAALHAGDPLIIEGVPGSGKSTLAAEVCRYLGLDPHNTDHFLRLFCTSDMQRQSFLYEWDDAKRLLHLQYITNLVHMGHGQKEVEQAMSELAKQSFSYRYLIIHTLLKAVLLPYRSVVLIDEVDKTFPEFDTILLDILEQNAFVIPEIGLVGQPNKPQHERPIFILTSNGHRDLSTPLRRRACYLNFGFHNEVTEAAILREKSDATQKEAEAVASFLRRMRKDNDLALSHLPSTAEGIKLLKGIKAQNLPVTEDSMLSLHGYWLKSPQDIMQFHKIYEGKLKEIFKQDA